MSEIGTRALPRPAWFSRCGPVLAVSLLMSTAYGCPPARSGGQTGEEACYWDQQEEEAAGTSTSVTESQVYLDLSRTMSGFISNGENGRPVTLLQELLRTILLEALGNVEVTPPKLWGFGREIFPLDHSLSSYAARESKGSVDPRDLYDQGETDVVGALEAASKQPSALSVVLTDNAQDLRTSKDSRAPGFDRSAMIRTITQDLAEHGFGVWLIGYRNSFRGTYFSILLAPNEKGVHINKPIALASDQPLYVWVVSKDLEKGRAVVDHLVRELRRRWSVRNSEEAAPVHAVELAPGVAPLVLPTEPSPPEIDPSWTPETGLRALDPRETLPRVRSWQRDERELPTIEAELVYQRTNEVNLRFPLQVDLERREPHRDWGNWPLSAWKLVWKTEGAIPGPSIKLSNDLSPFQLRSTGERRYRMLLLPFDQLTAYEPERRRVEVPLAVHFDEAGAPGDSWLAKWSTEGDTTKDGIEGKTLYLLDIANSVLAKTIGTQRPAACVHVALVEE